VWPRSTKVIRAVVKSVIIGTQQMMGPSAIILEQCPYYAIIVTSVIRRTHKVMGPSAIILEQCPYYAIILCLLLDSISGVRCQPIIRKPSTVVLVASW
jgi:hypothetical protein